MAVAFYVTGISTPEVHPEFPPPRGTLTARNKYVHEGVARVGRNLVTSERAGQLLGKVREILDWLEADLPDGDARAMTGSTDSRLIES
jgi:hypothetical protein